jgi:hypothetical protein
MEDIASSPLGHLAEIRLFLSGMLRRLVRHRATRFEQRNLLSSCKGVIRQVVGPTGLRLRIKDISR